MAKKILLLDDDMGRLGAIIDMIKSAGFEVAQFDRVKDFMASAPTILPQCACAVVDMMMPPDSLGELETWDGQRTGLVVLRYLKRQVPCLPVIIFTVVRDPEVEKQALIDGAAAYLNKPMLAVRLIKVIRKFTGEEKADGSA